MMTLYDQSLKMIDILSLFVCCQIGQYNRDTFKAEIIVPVIIPSAIMFFFR